MKTYLQLMQTILNQGAEKEDRTKTGTRDTFGLQFRHNLQDGFPLLTTKKMVPRLIIEELLWMLSGDNNVKTLQDKNVHIWDKWAKKDGTLGPSYGKQWRAAGGVPANHTSWGDKDAGTLRACMRLSQGDLIDVCREWLKRTKKIGLDLAQAYPASGSKADLSHHIVLMRRAFREHAAKSPGYIGGVDQIQNLVDSLKNNPDSRRHIVDSWDPKDVPKQALPCCHCFFQCDVTDGRLSLQLYQRSADFFLGVPFNIAAYAFLAHMLAQVCGLEVGDLIVTYGSAHLYSNHLEQARLQLSRDPKPLPQLRLNTAVKSIFDFTVEDFTLDGYEHHPAIKAPVAV